jgi:hypothetical protein
MDPVLVSCPLICYFNNMELSEINKRRTQVGWAAALVCLLLTLGILDGLIARFRQPLNVFHLLPGQSDDIDGPVPEHAGGLQDLGVISGSPEITLVFQSQEKGFWLGTPLWRGQIRVSDRIQPGDYQVRVIARARGQQPSSPVFLIRIHADAPSLQKSAASLIRRTFGISPWRMVLFWLPLAVGAFGLIFYLSGKREALLRAEGKAEVYRTRRTETGQEVSFGLGEAQGVHQGEILELFDDRGRLLGEVKVLTVDQKDAVAEAGPALFVRPGYLVAQKK